MPVCSKQESNRYGSHTSTGGTLDRYVHLFPGSEAAAVERIRSAFTQSVELRQTGTEAMLGVQHLVQQSGRFSVRTGASRVQQLKPSRLTENPMKRLVKPKKPLSLLAMPPQGLEPWTR